MCAQTALPPPLLLQRRKRFTSSLVSLNKLHTSLNSMQIRFPPFSSQLIWVLRKLNHIHTQLSECKFGRFFFFFFFFVITVFFMEGHSLGMFNNKQTGSRHSIGQFLDIWIGITYRYVDFFLFFIGLEYEQCLIYVFVLFSRPRRFLAFVVL